MIKRPIELKIGDKFSIRKSTNARKYIVRGIVLKICKENGFKYIAEENADKMLIPVNHGSIENAELILEKDTELYMR